VNESCYILAAEIITSLGVGLDHNWKQLLAQQCGIRKLQRFQTGKYFSDTAGEIPLDVFDELARKNSIEDDSKIFILSQAVIGELSKQLSGMQIDLSKHRTGLILSTTKADIEALRPVALGESNRPLNNYWNSSCLAQAVADANRLTGPVMAVSNACASGIVAILLAKSILQQNAADMMLVLGVDVLSDFVLSGFSSLVSLSKEPCKPYDAKRSGLSLGEGSGVLLLSKKSHSGYPFPAVIGGAANNDANHITGPSRTAEGLKLALKRTLKKAGLSPDDIDYINGHGTGTLYNDAMESKGISFIFGHKSPPITSMKGYFGHTLGAAGVIETALCTKILNETIVPSSLGFDVLDMEDHLNVAKSTLRLKKLNNLITFKCGFGGINAAIALQKKGLS